MERTIYNKNSTIMFLYLFTFAQLLIYVSNTQTIWDFNKGGQDWPPSCQNGDQAPIDISKPFEYRSNED
jgi:hypothetical protein